MTIIILSMAIPLWSFIMKRVIEINLASSLLHSIIIPEKIRHTLRTNHIGTP